MCDDLGPARLLPLRRMAGHAGVPWAWLKEQAEAGNIPGLKAGNRWLFAPDVVGHAVRAMAGDSMSMTPHKIDQLADAIAERLAGRVSDGADEIGDVHDAAKWLGCSVPTIERAVRRGEIPSIKVGRLRRFRRADLIGMNEERGQAHE